jgi:predicted XRE-type DNA-binding protein
MSKIEQYENVWDTIADTPGEAASLRAKADVASCRNYCLPTPSAFYW